MKQGLPAEISLPFTQFGSELDDVPSFPCSLLKMTGNVLILLLAAFSILYVGACAYAYLRSDTLIFPAPEPSYRDGPEILRLQADDGENIAAYFLEAEEPGGVLLFNHGNAEDLGYLRPLLETFRRRGISVLAYDYPGYGTSTGRPGETGVYAAADAAYRYLVEEQGVPPGSIVLYGRSLGSGPASWLAERYPVGGLILSGAFTSTFRVMTGVKVLPFDKFDNLARLPKVACPVLIIHGKDDRIIPLSHAEKNARALQNAPQTLWVEGAGHNNLIEVAGERYWKTVIDFIRQASN